VSEVAYLLVSELPDEIYFGFVSAFKRYSNLRPLKEGVPLGRYVGVRNIVYLCCDGGLAQPLSQFLDGKDDVQLTTILCAQFRSSYLNDNDVLQNLLALSSVLAASDYRLSAQLSKRFSRAVIHYPEVCDFDQILDGEDARRQSDRCLVIYDSARKAMASTVLALCPRGLDVDAYRVVDELQVSKDLSPFSGGYEYVINLCKDQPWKITLLAVAQRAICIGDVGDDHQRRCYPYSSFQVLSAELIWQAVSDLALNSKKKAFVVESAIVRAKSYSAQGFITELSRTVDAPLVADSLTAPENINESNLGLAIHHVFGPLHRPVESEEFVVFCLLKDAELYLDSWLQHYKKLGAVHFYIVDNGSTDGTVACLKDCTDVTLFKTQLAFSLYENDIRQYVVTTFCAKQWCLSVDIDEHFDYPFSDCISFSGLLRYHNQYGYTAMVSHMLEVFPKQTLAAAKFPDDYRYVDFSNVCRGLYVNVSAVYARYNVLPTQTFPFLFGGVRARMFSREGGQETLLLKHSLTFQDGVLEPHVDPHFCDKARVSDVAGVLYHYKFTGFAVANICERGDSEVYNYFANRAAVSHTGRLKDGPAFKLFTEDSVLLRDGYQLLAQGVMRCSESFRRFVLDHE